ncbi:MAG TPA: hypothetical protein VHC69_06550 [Polyangiaceae bacterium]|nr:hypothetical protein [Polyangiaceae bacterium]
MRKATSRREYPILRAEYLILRTCGVSGAFLTYGVLLSFDFEPVGSGIVAVIAGFMIWVAARTALGRARQREDDCAQP